MLADLLPDPVKRYVGGPYRVFRHSLATVDARLPERSLLRAVTGTALAVTDRLGPLVQPTVEPGAPGPSESSIETDGPGSAGADDPDVAREREADLAESRKHRQQGAARANKNLDTISQDVARSEAISDAREHREP
ncbi:MAG TPA: hypothetical protein VGH43_04955 [Jatrophihabitans sp.]|jgi:hypothetical protein